MTWSIRTPTACRKVARRVCTNGSYPAARRRQGSNGGTPQSWPAALKGSGGAPTDTPSASWSCQPPADAAPDLCPGRLQGAHLPPVDAVAVDQRRPVELRADALGEWLHAGHLLQAQVERVQEPAAGRVVRARLLGQPGQRRVEGV